MKRSLHALLLLCCLLLSHGLLAQEEVEEPEETAAEASGTASASGEHRLTLHVQGNEHLSEAELRAAIEEPLEMIRESGLNAALADDLAFFLEVYYRKQGYSQAQVTYKLTGPESLLLIAKEGPLTQIGKVTFSGNTAFPDERLKELLTGVAQPRRARRAVEIPYVEDNVSDGADRIRGLYRTEGYLDVEVDEPEVKLSADKTRADVFVALDEGTQYRFGKLEVEGDLLFFPRERLLKELEPFTSRPYTPLAVTNIQRKIIYFYRSHGYYLVEVDVESNPEDAVNGEVPSRFIVHSGRPYHFDGVVERYLKPDQRRLRPGFLQARFRSLHGKLYSPTALEERYRSVMATGLYSNLRLKQVPKPETGEVELHFDVEEAKARELGFSVGFGSLEGLILGAQYTDRNFLGYGRPLVFRSEISQYLLRGELSYTDPWVFDTNYTLRTRLYAMNQDLTDYGKLESGLFGELARKMGDHLEVSAFLLTRGVLISSYGIDPIELGPTEYVVNSLGTTLTLDFRDSVLNPSKGWVFTTTNDVALSALGSTVEFYRSTLRFSYYQPIGKTLLAIGARGGIIVPLGDEQSMPIDERFFNGGSRTIRSYVERSFGPKDRYGHSIGGETFTVFNVEHIFPIAGDLKGAVFVDAGTTGRRLDDGFGEFGMAVGLGLRYALPIGPIRVDYGHNPLKRQGDPTGAWHFSFGFAF